MSRYQVFAGKLTWYFIGVYIITILFHAALFVSSYLHIQGTGNRGLGMGIEERGTGNL